MSTFPSATLSPTEKKRKKNFQNYCTRCKSQENGNKNTEGLKALIFGQVLTRFGQILDNNLGHFAET